MTSRLASPPWSGRLASPPWTSRLASPPWSGVSQREDEWQAGELAFVGRVTRTGEACACSEVPSLPRKCESA